MRKGNGYETYGDGSGLAVSGYGGGYRPRPRRGGSALTHLAAVLALRHRAGLVLEVPDAPAWTGGAAVVRLNRTCIMAYSAKPVRWAERSAHVGRPGGRSSRSSGP